MSKFRKNLIVKQVSEASAQMCALKISVPKLEIEVNAIANFTKK